MAWIRTQDQLPLAGVWVLVRYDGPPRTYAALYTVPVERGGIAWVAEQYGTTWQWPDAWDSIEGAD